MNTLKESTLPELGLKSQGKVRDIYDIGDHLILIASDRLSIFDRVLPEAIPGKGQMLTEISRFWFDHTQDIIQNHLISQPDPNVLVVKKCRPLPIEMIIRGYLVGSLARDYVSGRREKCGVSLPDGLKPNDPLPEPIMTPTTKAKEGHDQDITPEELISSGLLTPALWEELTRATRELFERGTRSSKKRGLTLVDTKYEFGLDDADSLTLIDEIHTPDSSRFWYQKEAADHVFRFPDKEFVREWGRTIGFTGDGQCPHVPQSMIDAIRESYAHLYKTLLGTTFIPADKNPAARMRNNLKNHQLIKGYVCALLSPDEGMIAALQQSRVPFCVVSNPDELEHSIEPVVILHQEGAFPRSKWPTLPISHNRDDVAKEALLLLKTLEEQ